MSLTELIYFAIKYKSGAHLPRDLRPELYKRRKHSAKEYNFISPKRVPSISDIKEIDNHSEKLLIT